MDWDTISDKLTSVGDTTGRWLKKAFGSHTEREVKTLGTMIKRYGAEATKRRQKKIEELEAKAAKLREEVASMA